MPIFVPPLEYQEAVALFEEAATSGAAATWRQAAAAVERVSGRKRERKTIKPAYWVAIALLEREATDRVTALSEGEVADIAAKAGYGITPARVRQVAFWFDQWRGNQDQNLTRRGRHHRQVIYLTRLLRERARVGMPSQLLERPTTPATAALWIRTLMDASPLDEAEEDVERDWQAGPWDARSHPLVRSLHGHLGPAHSFWEKLTSAVHAFERYREALEAAYQAAVTSVAWEKPGLSTADVLALASLQLDAGLAAPGITAGQADDGTSTGGELPQLRALAVQAVESFRSTEDAHELAERIRRGACSLCS